jgi:hypothetical protein
MNARLAAVVRRREALVARIAAERTEIAQLASAWRAPLAVADLGWRLGCALRRHRGLVAVGTTFLVASQRHRLLRWAGRLFTFWELYRALRELGPAIGRRSAP